MFEVIFAAKAQLANLRSLQLAHHLPEKMADANGKQHHTSYDPMMQRRALLTPTSETTSPVAQTTSNAARLPVSVFRPSGHTNKCAKATSMV